MSIPSYTSRKQKLCTHAHLMDLALSHTVHTYGKTLAKDALPPERGRAEGDCRNHVSVSILPLHIQPEIYSETFLQI